MRARITAALFVLAFVPALIVAQGTTTPPAKPTPPTKPIPTAKPTPTPTPPAKPTPTPTPPAKPTPTPTPPAKPTPTPTTAPAKPTPAPTPSAKPATVPAPPTKPTPPVTPAPPDYVIGPDDVLVVVVWREKDMSGEVAVRPDGKISLPLLNDVQAAGLTPEQLRAQLTEAALKYVEAPEVTVIVKAINSRRVFITGQVAKPGPYPLAAPTTVLQLIATAGGVLEYADTKNIVILRNQGGKQVSFRFNYNDVVRRVNLNQNIELRPGDTVLVP